MLCYVMLCYVIFLSKLKKAKVVPMYKNDDQTEPVYFQSDI